MYFKDALRIVKQYFSKVMNMYWPCTSVTGESDIYVVLNKEKSHNDEN